LLAVQNSAPFRFWTIFEQVTAKMVKEKNRFFAKKRRSFFSTQKKSVFWPKQEKYWSKNGMSYLIELATKFPINLHSQQKNFIFDPFSQK